MTTTLQQAQTLLAEGQPGAALALVRAASAEASAVPELAILQAALESDHGDVAAAQAIAAAVVRAGVTQAVRPGAACVSIWLTQAALILGGVFSKQQQWDRALHAYAVACYVDPNAVPLALARCRALQCTPDGAAAVAAFSVAEADVVFVTGGLTTPLADAPPWALFDGKNYAAQSLGGSESAFIEVTRSIAAQGRRVTAFTPCLAACQADGVMYRPNAEYFLAAAIAGARQVIVSRNQWYLRDVPPVTRRWFWVHDAADVVQYRDWQWSAAQCERICCVSARHAQQWTHHFALPADMAQVFSNGFSPQYFSDTVDTPRAPRLVYLSRPERGLQVALSSFTQLRARWPQLELHVATYDPHGTQQDVAAQYGEAAHTPGVVCLPGLDKPGVAALLQSARALWYPNISHAETSCMAAIEAMAAGCPVIASDRGALPETVPDGVGGCIVPYSDDHALLAQHMIDAVEPLLRDPAAWQALSRSAAAHAHARYRWERIAAQWANALG